ncbi:MAG: choice-of-anchor D domain-containing protein [Myxococcaceae bacterium]
MLVGFVFAAAVVSQACQCAGVEVSRSYGELGIVHRDESDQIIISRDATYDFGTLMLGETLQKKLIVKNLGGGPLNLVSIEPVEGTDVTVGSKVVEGAALDVRFIPNTGVGASESVEFDMVFSPRKAEGNPPTQDFLVKLVLTADGTREGEGTATITLRATAVSSACLVPPLIDFGEVALGMHGAKSIELENRSAVDTQAFVGPITSETGDHQAFGAAPGMLESPLMIAAGTARSLDFEFRPTEARAYSAKVKVRPGTYCDETEVTLTGRGLDGGIEWTPTSLDFHYVSPGTEAVKWVTFKNLSSVNVELFDIATSLPADLAMKSEEGADPTKFVVPAHGERQMPVVCNPTSLGKRAGQLTFKTPITRTPSGVIALTCYGGGPDIDVLPSSALNFGMTTYFAESSPPFSISRRLTVLNRGTAPPDGSFNGNLRLGQVSPTGVPGQLPFVAVRPLNATTSTEEIRVGIPPSYQPNVGLEAVAGRNSAELVVTLTPTSVGRKEAELIIYSNDPDEPETKILITSDVVMLPSCNYSVSPAQVSFGLVTPSTVINVPVTFTNNGAAAGEICIISGVQLAPGSDPAYSMPGGPVQTHELGPGESLQVLVRVAPQGPVPAAMLSLTGALQFSVSSPTQPSGTVPLETRVGPACVTVAPGHLDFGAVMPGCNSSTRTFAVYNVCPLPVRIARIYVVEAAGQQPGGPNCAGPAPCPEFHLDEHVPNDGQNLPAGADPVNFQARYSPIDLSQDSGVIGVDVLQAGVTTTYLVTLQGSGDPSGKNTDTFVQNSVPKADVLFTVDNSGSMEKYQTSLANNFASFIGYAQNANVDWQIGVTTTDIDLAEAHPPPGPGAPDLPGGVNGRLIGDVDNPKILNRNIPNVAELFRAKVNVGLEGSTQEQGLEASLRAITPPLSVNENAGFVRPDASLAVVLVTDARNQSEQDVAYYVNSFLNIKGFNNAHLFSFNAIAGFNPRPPKTCVYDEGPDDGSFAEVVQLTHGVREEICTTDWSASLQGIAQAAFGFRTTFNLTGVPDMAQPISVMVNGVDVPQTSGGTTQWTYDPVANAVVFKATAAPGPGASMDVTYYLGCMP